MRRVSPGPTVVASWVLLIHSVRRYPRAHAPSVTRVGQSRAAPYAPWCAGLTPGGPCTKKLVHGYLASAVGQARVHRQGHAGVRVAGKHGRLRQRHTVGERDGNEPSSRSRIARVRPVTARRSGLASPSPRSRFDPGRRSFGGLREPGWQRGREPVRGRGARRQRERRAGLATLLAWIKHAFARGSAASLRPSPARPRRQALCRARSVRSARSGRRLR